MAGPSKVKIALEAAALATTTIILLVVFITNGLAAAPNADKYGFRNTTGDISDEFYTQVSKAIYTFEKCPYLQNFTISLLALIK